MKAFQCVALAALLAAGCVGSAAAQAKAGDLATVLHQMDDASGRFKSAQADVQRDLYELVVKQTTTQTGSIYYQRNGTGMQIGMKLNPPGAKTVEIKDGMVRLFDPTSNHLSQYSVKNNQAQIESFLAIGFGGSGTDLSKQWTITYKGTSQMSDGKKMVAAAELDLVAKDEKSRQTFDHITIWVDPTQDVSLKQKFFLTSGDVQTATYTNIRLNQLTKDAVGAFAIKTDKKTTVETH